MDEEEEEEEEGRGGGDTSWLFVMCLNRVVPVTKGKCIESVNFTIK